VLKSTDGGATWNPSSVGLINHTVWTLGLDPTRPTRLFAGTEGGVFTSADGGATWSATRIRSGMTRRQLASDIRVHPATIAKWERGEAQPMTEFGKRLHRKLELRPGEET